MIHQEYLPLLAKAINSEKDQVHFEYESGEQKHHFRMPARFFPE